MTPKKKTDLDILGVTREPIVMSCEQCNERLGYVVGGCSWDEMPGGTVLCAGCIGRLAEWIRA